MKPALDSCRWVTTQLPRYLDGELALDLGARVSLHLDRCELCRRALAEESELLVTTVNHLVPSEPPPHLLDSAMAKIEFAAGSARDSEVAPVLTPPPPLKIARRPVSSALAAAAVLAFVIWAIPSADLPKSQNRLAPVASNLPELQSEPDSSTGRSNEFASSQTNRVVSSDLLDSGSIVVSDEPPLVLQRGDVDTNGRVDFEDLQQIHHYLHGGGDAPACLAAADFDGDGEITMSDSASALRRVVGDMQDLDSIASAVFVINDRHPDLPCNPLCP